MLVTILGRLIHVEEIVGTIDMQCERKVASDGRCEFGSRFCL